MRKLLLVICCCMFLFSGCEDTNLELVAGAGIDAVKAVTLSDGDVKMMAVEASRQSDAKHKIASKSNVYGRRLHTLVGDTYSDEGYTFNFKVYLSDQVNAFAMACWRWTICMHTS